MSYLVLSWRRQRKTKKQTAKNKLITKEDNMRERERERERRVIPDFGWRIKKKKKQ